VAFTLLIASACVAWAGAPVATTWGLLLQGGFGSVFAWSETLTRAVPLMLTGLAAAVAFQARLFNIGAEGQLYLARWPRWRWAACTAAAASRCPLAAVPADDGRRRAGRRLLLLGPALMKARLGVDEVVTTLLLNFIVALFIGAMLDGPMKDPLAMGWPQSVALQPELELAKLVPQTRVHTGLLWALVLAGALWALMRRTVLGFQIRAVGANARAAAFAGVPVQRTVVLVALLSGALAGLAGAIEVAGRTSYLTLDLSPGYGYSGIVIAMLAGLHPLGVVLASVFVAGVLVGADSMSRAVGVPTYLADVIVATALLSVLVAALAARYRLVRSPAAGQGRHERAAVAADAAREFWVAVLRIATPLILGTLGVLLCERAGVLNLGVEGIWVAGAFAGWLAVYRPRCGAGCWPPPPWARWPACCWPR
jgi:simple sugar transport system permease protein